eukprot:CAMPEP_0181326672 /NCGR_PEP_ID=MMETSP1101-20121128/21646_1 /TAXON_ID=46948 /ORGANISM="Rhodomonas abbreviata, Strain Caron Lab Isolate" /LENGTH=185 /DNA_ID=CAMNT_0023435187 /DNA_START=139 /DNA_END=692 /DNA_ORIENTATION=-
MSKFILALLPLSLLLLSPSVLGFPVQLTGKGKIVAVPPGAEVPHGAQSIPHGLRLPAGPIVDATHKARSTGQAVAFDIPAAVKTTHGRKENHKQRMASMTDSQISDSADAITGDGARPTRQPVDEVSKLIAMLPYALVILAFAVVFLICIMGRISRYVSAEQSSYFQDGKQADTKIAPKGGVRMG